MRLSIKNIKIILIVAFICLPLFNYNISLNFGGLVYIAFSYLLLLISMSQGIAIQQSESRFFKAILCLMIFSVLYAFGMQFFNGHASFVNTLGFNLSSDLYNMLANLPVWLACAFLLLSTTGDEKTKITNIIWVLFVYTEIVTIIALLASPTFARDLAAVISSPEIEHYKKLGAAGFDMTYSISILTPLFFALFKEGRGRKWLALFIISIVYVLECAFLIAIVSLLFNCVLSYALSLKNKTLKVSIIILLIIFSTTIVLNAASLGMTLIKMSSSINNYDISTRLSQVGRMLAFGDSTGDSLGRFRMYGYSLQGIKESPIFGTLIFDNNYLLSGHSTVLDTWGGLGILPFGFLIGFVVNMCKFSTRHFNGTSIKYVIISAYITFMIEAILNPMVATPLIVVSIMFIIPIFAQTISQNDNQITGVNIR